MQDNLISSMSRTELAEYLGISVRTLYKVIKNSGIAIEAWHPIPAEDLERIIDYYRKHGTKRPKTPPEDRNE